MSSGSALLSDGRYALRSLRRSPARFAPWIPERMQTIIRDLAYAISELDL